MLTIKKNEIEKKTLWSFCQTKLSFLNLVFGFAFDYSLFTDIGKLQFKVIF